jgi:hypothetical protein
MAARTGVGDLIEKLEDMAPCTLPEKFAMSGVINTVMELVRNRGLHVMLTMGDGAPVSDLA